MPVCPVRETTVSSSGDKNCEEIAKTLIDLDDVEKCKEYKWHLSKEGYVIGLKNEKRIKLHRLLLDLQDNNYCVDHINRNPLDNRKSNLRICTNADNAINKNINRANKSGVIGVSWYKVRNKWVASIGFNNKKKTLGYFENFDDAVRVRLKAEKEYFGEFAPQRHLFEQYEIA
jgi:hypothetical protein